MPSTISEPYSISPFNSPKPARTHNALAQPTITIMKKLFQILFVAAAIAVASSCSKEPEPEPNPNPDQNTIESEYIIGQWHMDEAAYVRFLDGGNDTADATSWYENVYLEFREDGTMTFSQNGSVAEYGWYMEDDRLMYVYPDGSEVEYIVENLTQDNLRIHYDDGVYLYMVLSKVSKALE